ncbi:8077_t:CDS:2, partial [Racocetra persica]
TEILVQLNAWILDIVRQTLFAESDMDIGQYPNMFVSKKYLQTVSMYITTH